MIKDIGRRKFLLQITQNAACMSFAPIPLLAALPKNEREPLIPFRPFWINILSKGPNYFPSKATILIPANAGNIDIKNEAYKIAEYGFAATNSIKAGKLKQTDELMDFAVICHKKAQYLLGKLPDDFKYHCFNYMDNVTNSGDPVLGRIMRDLSWYILSYIENLVKEPDFKEFGMFQNDLLTSALGYSLEGIHIFRKVVEKTFEKYKPANKKWLSIVYNNYGLALKYLGRIDEAISAYRKALEFFPDFGDAIKNLENIKN